MDEPKQVERTTPLTECQQECLVALVSERRDVLQCRSQGSRHLVKKKQAWEEVTTNFNAMNPGIKPRDIGQLKRAWNHVKRRVKDENSKNHHSVCATVGGPPSDPPKYTAAMTQAMQMMGQVLAMNSNHDDSMAMPQEEEDDPAPITSSAEEVPLTLSPPAITPTPSPPVVPLPSPSTSSTFSFSSPHNPSTSKNDNQTSRKRKRQKLDEFYQTAQASQDAWLQTKKRLLEEEHAVKMMVYAKAGCFFDSAQRNIDSFTHSLVQFLAVGQKAYAEMAELYRRKGEQQKEQSNTIHEKVNKNPPPRETSKDQGNKSSEQLSSIEQVEKDLNLPDIWKPENTLKEIIKTETFLEEEVNSQATIIKEEPS
ncbi:myb/SANT-like DNA-binding domain-containing protein 3 isoform X2 [Penaeus japonicus]|uniref:myb/SANT-like DNA-binding domain-containing protein 3 isoform X2 n=1 Tax=Penaeus japonicus TaxID=27405 RepID=UPI001C711469|nr:myb/SANT-like DNA-binding domain-containing protein 3 isoform X2 [Penaeus japonicus]